MNRSRNFDKYFTLFTKRFKGVGWLDALGVAIFFFILFSGVFFLLRRGSEVIVTMRLLERNSPDFYFNLPRHFYVENLRPGMKETDEAGRNALEILEVFSYPTGEIYQEAYITLRVKTVFNKKTGQHSFNGKPLLNGDYYTFRLKDIVINGIIIDISDKPLVREKKAFQVEGYLDPTDHEVLTTNQEIILYKDYGVTGIKNYLAEKIVPGLKMYDGKGEVIAEVISASKLPGRRSMAQNNQYFTVSDSERVEVKLTFELTAEKINDSFYFQKLTPLLIGRKFNFVSGYLSIKPTITSVKSLD